MVSLLLIIGVFLGPTLLLAVAIWFGFQGLQRLAQELRQIYHLRMTPCGQCLYYTHQPELRCAVNPYAALTSAAQDCRDFVPVGSRVLTQNGKATPGQKIGLPRNATTLKWLQWVMR
ncbi:MAG: hypothetical protein AAGG51_00335 [Cyanobacteria bacterium P01_G01_bin.54]